MRILSLPAACAVFIAMLAGCSNETQGAAALPAAAPGDSAAAAGRQMSQQSMRHKISPMELLKLQAAGKIEGPSPRAVMKRILQRIETGGRLHLKAQPNAGTVSVWASATYDNYIVGLKKNLTKTVAVIPATYNNCIYPTQIKVDHAHNLWAGCQMNTNYNNYGSVIGGSVSEWSNAGTPIATYSEGCPSNWGSCSYPPVFHAYDTFASAADANHVFAAIGSVSGWSCYYYYWCYVGGTGVEWWPAGQPSSRPTIDFIDAGSIVGQIDYMDEDSSGNLWFTYTNGSVSGAGLGEITNPTSPSWAYTSVEAPGTYQCAGGVYVSNAGAVLNVTDPCTRKTYQYALPLSTGGAPTNTLGPTRTNSFGQGAPVSGGFNTSGTKLILSDSYGWLDRGTVFPNTWTIKTNPNVQNPQGAAFTPSDK